MGFLSRLIFGEEKKYPEAELIFPGVSDYDNKKNSTDVAAFISTWTGHLSKGAKFIPVAGEVSGHILTAVSTMAGMLKKAETKLEKIVDKNLGFQAIGDIQAKLVTIENRLKEVEQAMERGQSFDTPIAIAADKCEEVLQRFSQESGYLYKGVNCLFSTPSLVSFAGLYTGVALIKFKISPDRRGHIIEEMKLLKQVMENYRKASVSERMKYVKGGKQIIGGRDPYSIYEFNDSFYELTPCQSARDAYRYIDGTLLLRENVEYKFTLKYENELKSLYYGHFTEPLNELGKLTKAFEKASL